MTNRTARGRTMQGLVIGLLLAAFLAVFAPSAGAAPTGPFTVDPTNRENVRRLWYSAHEATAGGAIDWTGSRIDRLDVGARSQPCTPTITLAASSSSGWHGTRSAL